LTDLYLACAKWQTTPRRKGAATSAEEIAMLFIIPTLLLVAAVAGAYRLGRQMGSNLSMQDATGHMPEGAAHEFT
jgi:hypothetical protein